MAAAAIIHRKRATVAVQLRIGSARVAIAIDVDADTVAGLEGHDLWEAVYPAVLKELEDLTFEVVEVREG